MPQAMDKEKLPWGQRNGCISRVVTAVGPFGAKMLKRLNINHKMRANPLTLSGGEQQRVAIARALVNEPIILLADEPTGGLDPEASQRIMDVIADVNARGTTVVVATHNLDIVKSMGRRVIHLEGGKVVHGGNP